MKDLKTFTVRANRKALDDLTKELKKDGVTLTGYVLKLIRDDSGIDITYTSK